MYMEIVEPIIPYLIGALLVGFICGWLYRSRAN